MRKGPSVATDFGGDVLPLCSSVWVHAFEEDTPEGAVYRPEGKGFPLSRRPRRRLSFRADGSAVVADGGADDRLVGRAATWTERDGGIVIRSGGGACLRVVDRGPRWLLVRTEPEGGD